MKLSVVVKKSQISQDNSRVMAVVAVACVITIFSLISVKSLLGQASHQKKIINARNDAAKQLKADIDVANRLSNTFDVFNSANPNMIGGIADNKSTGPLDGDNSRITLDALPSQYDFPALISSLEKILSNDKISNPSISGTDTSATSSNSSSPAPQPVTIPVTVSGTTNYAGVQNLIKDFERSIRPFDITNLQLGGNEASMQFSLSLNTYYQPAKSLDLGSKEVK